MKDDNQQPKRGEIWEVHTEKGNKRCLIVSNDVGNRFSDIFMGVDVKRGRKRKPTHMGMGRDVAAFEHIATYAREQMIAKLSELPIGQKKRMAMHHEAVSQTFLQKPSGLQCIHPPIDVGQWEAYFIDLGEGVGSVQSGERLVFVLSNDALNQTGHITVIPATKRRKKQLATHVSVPAGIGIPLDSTLLLEQMRTVDRELFAGKQALTVLPMNYREQVLEAKEVSITFSLRKRETVNK